MQSSNTANPPRCESVMLRRALGARGWERLAESIRRAHKPEIERRGRFRVEHGPGPPSRFLARILRLPDVAPDVEARLLIVAEADCERWQRSFGGKPFRTLQRWEGDSMIERWGWIELRFELRVENGGLRYEQSGAALRAGRLRVPLPRSLAPRVEALESAVSASSVRVSVKVVLPFIGLLINYDGVVEVGR